jgi:hypothetical protein
MEEGKFHVYCTSSWHTLDNVHYQKSETAVLYLGDNCAYAQEPLMPH